jgi:hypothetical protein
VLLDLLEERVHAFRMEVEGSREGGRSRPRRVTPEELQDDSVAGNLAPRGLTVIRKDVSDFEPDPAVPVECDSDVRGLEDGRASTAEQGLEPTPLGCSSRPGFDLSRILLTRRRSSGYIVRKSTIQPPADSHGGCRNHSGR